MYNEKEDEKMYEMIEKKKNDIFQLPMSLLF